MGYVLAADLRHNYSLTPGELGYRAGSVLYAFEANATADVMKLDGSLHMGTCGLTDFRLFTVVPDSGYGFALLGETDKWVAVSSQRFSDLVYGHWGTCGSVAVSQPDRSVTVSEEVVVRWMTPMGVRTSKCAIPPGGTRYAF